MTNLLKFFLMALAWALLWAVSYYGCITPDYCLEDAVTVVTKDYELASKTGSAEVLSGDLWPTESQGLLDKYKADPTQTLEVFGHYYEGEVSAPGDRALGQRRADTIKVILVKAGIPATSITATPRGLNSAVPEEGKLWDAGAFAWAQAAEEGQTDKVTELAEDQIKINFPYNESTIRLSDNTEDYLKTLAKLMTEIDATVAIVGHTDDRGKNPYNITLGQKRADFLKKRLVNYGVQANRISTSSQGEERPEVRNATTDAEHYENRRAILTLTRVQ